MGVAHGHPVDVRDRQGEAGPLQQGRPVIGVGEGRHARTHPGRHFRFRLQQGLAQFGQGRAAQDRADEQTIRLQRPPRLDQGSDQVIGPVQRQGRHHQVQRGVGQRQGFLVQHQARAGAARQHGLRQVRLDQQADLGGGVAVGQGLGEHPAAGAQVQGQGELPLDGLQPFDDVLGRPALEEVGGRIAARGPRQAAAVEGAVEEKRRGGHGARYRDDKRPTARDKAMPSCALDGPGAGRALWRSSLAFRGRARV